MLEKVKKFINETRVEMRKVTWPTKQELKDSTKIVIVATFIVTVFIDFSYYIIDFSFNFFLRI